MIVIEKTKDNFQIITKILKDNGSTSININSNKVNIGSKFTIQIEDSHTTVTLNVSTSTPILWGDGTYTTNTNQHMYRYSGEYDIYLDLTAIPSNFISPADVLYSFDLEKSVVKSLTANAFKNCINLTTVVLPDSVKTIGLGAFSGCYNISSLSFYSIDTDYKCPLGYVFGTDAFDGTVATAHGRGLGSNWSTYYIPEALTTLNVTGPQISEGFCEDCTTLTEITLSNALCKNISAHAFRGTDNLQTFSIDNPEDIQEHAFFNSGIQEFNSSNPGYIKTIGIYAFAYSELKTFKCGRALERIDHHAFYNCANLETLDLDFSYRTVLDSNDMTKRRIFGQDAFRGCTVLSKVRTNSPEAYAYISFTKGTSNYLDYYSNPLCNNANTTKQVVNFTNLSDTPHEQLELEYTSYSILGVSPGAFIYCPSLKRVSLLVRDPSDSEDYWKITTIGRAAFFGCTALEAVELQNVYISNYSFQKCPKLASIYMSSIIGNADYSSNSAEYNWTRTKSKYTDLTSTINAPFAASGSESRCDITLYKTIVLSNPIDGMFNQHGAPEAECMRVGSIKISGNIAPYMFYKCNFWIDITINTADLYNNHSLVSILAPTIGEYAFGCLQYQRQDNGSIIKEFSNTLIIKGKGSLTIAANAFSRTSPYANNNVYDSGNDLTRVYYSESKDYWNTYVKCSDATVKDIVENTSMVTWNYTG